MKAVASFALPLLAFAAALPLRATAADIDSLQNLAQREFRLLSEDLGAALSYKPLIPAEALGITGFDIGIAITGTTLKNSAVLERATSSSDVPGTLPVPTIRVHKGLPFNIDVGALYAQIPDSNLKYYGGELRYAVLPGSTVVPAVALRLAHTRVTGVDQLKFNTTSVDVSVSKGFAMFTPYAGVGQVWVTSTPQNIPGAALREEKFNDTKVFVGLNINFGLNVALEYDNTGGINSYGVKFGARF